MDAKNLILAILHRKPNISSFRLAKLCYLYDLACIQTRGKACTDLPYIWHLHGPYCDDFEKANIELQEAGKLEIAHVVTKEYDCNLHTATTPKAPKLGELEDELLDFIVNRFAGMSAKQLEDFVYSTPPMVKAQKSRVRFHPLDMHEKGKAPAAFFDQKTVLSLVRSYKTPKSKYVPWEKVWEKIKALPLQRA
jgi:hypothetical protein